MAEQPDAVRWQIRVQGVEQVIQAGSGETLLSALEQAGVPVRHACRNGVCEICEARLIVGAVTQRYPALQIQAGGDAPLLRLCAAYAASDLELELMPYAWKR
ncbi:2Fe-2S iron-sulfur cluster-binding protein [Marinobacterium mangrovicola]|uniref:Ferredoxin n=1 Tax=Marinobacterium mangrovicola TaxID=1476959 RepID=A0A4R1GCQ7_9GAMM|nr:2Fe-2S iron-sulfur cluster-binding protein [Marinobacterium mangrovicola]TCK06057.1 ferredoxin [Marinobacterium mangrovicola]